MPSAERGHPGNAAKSRPVKRRLFVHLLCAQAWGLLASGITLPYLRWFRIGRRRSYGRLRIRTESYHETAGASSPDGDVDIPLRLRQDPAVEPGGSHFN